MTPSAPRESSLTAPSFDWSRCSTLFEETDALVGLHLHTRQSEKKTAQVTVSRTVNRSLVTFLGWKRCVWCGGLSFPALRRDLGAFFPRPSFSFLRLRFLSSLSTPGLGS